MIYIDDSTYNVKILSKIIDIIAIDSGYSALGLAQRYVFKVNQTAQNQLMNILEPMQFLEHLTHNSVNSDNSDNLKDQLLTEKIAKRIDSLQLMLEII
ncbi:20722_t:CDS:2 [Gigaspora margarita]|uniref:20722_t:CDS:1 n=1 Tax=Gigaspora margarita TaxID=4874 RepID=A0ABM8W5K9_GIGMA|nr:20722_t:CDS:2 [Gigaspora margarita]